MSPVIIKEPNFAVVDNDRLNVITPITHTTWKRKLAYFLEYSLDNILSWKISQMVSKKVQMITNTKKPTQLNKKKQAIAQFGNTVQIV